MLGEKGARTIFWSGVLLGSSAAVTVVIDQPTAATALAACAGVFAVWLTYIIARRQDCEAGALRDLVEKIHFIQLRDAERESALDYDPGAVESESDDSESQAEAPDYAQDVVDRLRVQGADVDPASLRWRRKQPAPRLPGNHGWFVETPDGAGRWYARKARGLTVRKAMPRAFLEELRRSAGVDPQQIKRDFQLKEHGLAAWYARTYEDDLWKVWRSNRNPAAGIQVKRVDRDRD